MWAMHSLRESAGVHDHGWMIAAMTAAFAGGYPASLQEMSDKRFGALRQIANRGPPKLG